MEAKSILEKFESLYSSRPILFKSPGRINLIGEHTDYNDGYVLPATIDKAIIFALCKNSLSVFRVFSFDLEEYFEIQINDIKVSKTIWANFLLGVIAQIQKTGKAITGIDCVFGGDIPIGAGLSSSAAIECGFAFGINELFNFKFTRLEIVKMAQKAEHEFAGVMCGIMDQFANIHGKSNHVIQLDCRTLNYKYYPLELNDYKIILCDTQVKHSLASTEYNHRRKECEEGVTILQKYDSSIQALRDVDIEFLNKHKNEFDPVIFKRCKYVINENQRVLDACISLNNDNLDEFGKLMYASHEGLKNDYEVSCKELDMLVEIAKNSQDVIGSRMMGGGFGGCTINLVKKESSDKFAEKIMDEYFKTMKIKPQIYHVNIGEGTCNIN